MANTHRVLDLGLLSLTVIGLAAGCSHTESPGRRGGMVAMISAQVPAFVNGPANLLLTNAGGFDARVEVQGDPAFTQSASGQLLCRGGKLLFAPDPDSNNSIRIGGFSFVWDVAESRGFVLSEALQAYAPVSTSLRATNLSFQAGGGGSQKLDGHPCEPQEAVVRMSDGTAAGFRLLRATDLSGLPLQVASTGNPLRLTLSKARFEVPPAALFSPPEGFSKFPSPEAMADELASRQRNLHRKSRDEPGLFLPSTPEPNRRY